MTCLPFLTPLPTHMLVFKNASGPLLSVSISTHSLNLYSLGSGTFPWNPSLAAAASRAITSDGPVRHPRVESWT